MTRAMSVRAIDHVNVRAPAALVAELKRFYEAALGLRDGWRPPFASTGHWLYLDDRALVHLVVDDDVLATPRAGRGPVVDHVSFACAGLRATQALLDDERIAYRRTEVPGTTLVQLFMVDPAGNGVELQFDAEQERR